MGRSFISGIPNCVDSTRKINMNTFTKAIHQRGLYATIRQAKNLGVSFIDCYVAVFGKMPKLY